MGFRKDSGRATRALDLAASIRRLVRRLGLPNRSLGRRLSPGSVIGDRDDVTAESVGDLATDSVYFVNSGFRHRFPYHLQATPQKCTPIPGTVYGIQSALG